MHINISSLRFMIVATFLQCIFFISFLGASIIIRVFIPFENFITLLSLLDNVYVTNLLESLNSF